MDGLDALAAFKKIDREVPVIVVSGQGRTPTVVQAMKLGASDFVSKPFDDTDLENPLAHAVKQRQLSQEVASLREQLAVPEPLPDALRPGERMAEVQNLIDRVADTDVHRPHSRRERHRQGACGAGAVRAPRCGATSRSSR